MQAPAQSEYDPFYATYIDSIPGRPILELLAEAPVALAQLLAPVTPEGERYAYARGKWTLREVVGHVIDAERLFAYRALHFARSDPAELPGIDQEIWARSSKASERSLADLLAEFKSLRDANTALFGSFDEETLDRRGVASGVEFTVRALIYVIVGHEIHHRGILRRLYLEPLATAGEPHRG
ncbi:MAG: DinB family protein [Acidobacteria bacterium]|nr:DinB family protein [Acidobacteriota bacterium]